jgi:Tn3 transposase DDE domain
VAGGVGERRFQALTTATSRYNNLYLSQKLEEIEDAATQVFLDAVAHGSVISWQHINLLGEYDFSDKKLQDNVGIRPPKLTPKEVKNFGAAEPGYVLQSPGLVENCVGLYVPLLEFNQRSTLQSPAMPGVRCAW